jgi:signal transduction histidine kinase
MLTPWQVPGLTQARIDLWARTSCLSIGVVLSLATGQLFTSLGTLVLLCLLALAMTLFALSTGPGSREYLFALVAEGAVAGAFVLLGPPASDVYIIYIVAPALISGLRAGLRGSLGVVVGELLSAVAAHAQLVDVRPQFLGLWAPWIFMSFAVGLLGAWIRQLRLLQKDTRPSPYASAHHLLGQLRKVTRELSGGLDIEVVSEAVLSTAAEALGGGRAALLLRDEAGDVAVVAHRGGDAFTASLDQDPFVQQVLRSQDAQQQPASHGRAGHRFRACLPLLVGSRAIGVVVIDGPSIHTPEELRRLQTVLDDEALRLESALLFSDIRALATVEERSRLAREIHDGVAQEIASLGYLVDDLARDQCNQRHQNGLLDLRHELTRVVTELRLSIFDLRSGVSSNDGLGSVLGDYVRQVGKSSGMTVHLSLEESPHRLRLNVETELLRIAQEAVTNARKHSHAANLWVTCRVEPPFAEIRIEDDGRGAVRARDDHYGLHMMKERATRINAVLTLAERPGGGTIVSSVLLPADIAATPESGEPYALHRLAG